MVSNMALWLVLGTHEEKVMLLTVFSTAISLFLIPRAGVTLFLLSCCVGKWAVGEAIEVTQF